MPITCTHRIFIVWVIWYTTPVRNDGFVCDARPRPPYTRVFQIRKIHLSPPHLIHYEYCTLRQQNIAYIYNIECLYICIYYFICAHCFQFKSIVLIFILSLSVCHSVRLYAKQYRVARMNGETEKRCGMGQLKIDKTSKISSSSL